MNFHERTTVADTLKRLGVIRTIQEFPLDYFMLAAKRGEIPRHMAAQARDELQWIEDKRPYYNVWPGIVEPLRATKLNVPGTAIHLPRSPILLRFAQGKEPRHRDEKILSILAAETTIATEFSFAPPSPDDQRGLVLWCDLGERVQGTEFPVLAYRIFALDDRTIDESLEDSRKLFDPMTDEEEEILVEAVKIVIAVSLLGEDSEFFDPDVLSKDRAAFNFRPRPEIIQRAHRRGKVGWDVGKELHATPHIVAPYFAIRWMGAKKGQPGSKAILRPISGYVPKRKMLTEVPTGYLDEENPND